MLENEAKQKYQDIFHQISGLVLYRSILSDDLVDKAIGLLHSVLNWERRPEREALYYAFCSEIYAKGTMENLHGELWKEHILHLILRDENSFSLAIEIRNNNNLVEPLDAGVYQTALCDAEILQSLYNLDIDGLALAFNVEPISLIGNFKSTVFPACVDIQGKKRLQGALADENPEKIIQELISYYQTAGSGQFGQYSAFRWEQGVGIVGIKRPEKVSFTDLIGCQKQKDMLMKNTEAFVRGQAANNVLLFGDRGTGKSSSIKALLNEYAFQGLRLLEIAKHQLVYLREIISNLAGRNARFIVYIDDLSFEEFEVEYKYLKAIIEGGIEARPANVLIYATSNRRHLVSEKWSDRGKPEDVHASDTTQEKLSLADRFGITITFTSPDQEQYLDIVKSIADKDGIIMPPHELREQALKWELWHNGRSGRTARQFIDFLLGEVKE